MFCYNVKCTKYVKNILEGNNNYIGSHKFHNNMISNNLYMAYDLHLPCIKWNI